MVGLKQNLMDLSQNVQKIAKLLDPIKFDCLLSTEEKFQVNE
jgi:hypothetical protein